MCYNNARDFLHIFQENYAVVRIVKYTVTFFFVKFANLIKLNKAYLKMLGIQTNTNQLLYNNKTISRRVGHMKEMKIFSTGLK
jgi:hypothetical protein